MIKILTLYLKVFMKGLHHGSLENRFLQAELHVDMKAVVEKAWCHGIEKGMVQECHQGLMIGVIGIIAGPLGMIGGGHTGVEAGAGVGAAVVAQLKTQGVSLNEMTEVEVDLRFRGKSVGIFLLEDVGGEVSANLFTKMWNFMTVPGH